MNWGSRGAGRPQADPGLGPGGHSGITVCRLPNMMPVPIALLFFPFVISNSVCHRFVAKIERLHCGLVGIWGAKPLKLPRFYIF